MNWIKPHIRHCDWDGITCDDANNSIKLELQSNGLSGSLTQNISKLRSLEVKVRHVTIHDTILVMKLLAFLFIFVFVVVFLVTIQPGLISTEISLLSNLTHLRLSYNDFTGKVGTNFTTLQGLKLIHLNRKRLSGNVSGNVPEMTFFLAII